MPNKREEIRKGIEKILDDEIDFEGKYCKTAEQVGTELLMYLHSQDIKLPNGEPLVEE